MTNPTPVLQGAPDFLPQLASSNIKLQSFAGNIAASRATGVMYCGNSPFLYVAQSCAVGMLTSMSFFGNDTGTELLPGTPISTDATAQDAVVCVPVQGPYVSFTSELSAYPNTISFDAFAVPSRFNVHSGAAGQNMLISVLNTNLAGGANIQLSAITVRSGKAEWTADLLGATSFIAYLISIDALGNTMIVDYINQVNRAQRRTVYLAPMRHYIHMFNLDGVAHQYNVLLNHPVWDF